MADNIDPAFDDEVEQTVSINEYLEEVEAEELEADMILGGDDGQECTYTNEYMKRQAIFSCLTCTPNGDAGFCTACSLTCHDGHEILELWTKRDFRCDCGNSKFGKFSCKLFPNKESENTENSYNHNFKGLYCTCGRPYPDPDVQDQVDMIQCCMCEDWFHEEHLGLNSSEEIPRDEEGEPTYEDFICKACSTISSFLCLYPQVILSTAKEHDHTVKVSESVSEGKKPITGESSEKDTGPNQQVKDNTLLSTCILGGNPVDTPFESKPLFLIKNWRDIICRCDKCLDMYNQRNVSYLVDKEYSIAEYETRAKQRREEKIQQQEGAQQNFFNNLSHVAKMELLSGIADVKDEFRSFLETTESSKRAITSDDIHQIFDNLKKKRQRVG
ncbi:hypothetical protein ACFE04_005146 [Oxalis oulophora]